VHHEWLLGLTLPLPALLSPRYKELRDYILARRDALGPPPSSGAPAATEVKRPKGAALTAAELMGESEPAAAGKNRGF
jgi:hypothetical protein